MVNHVHRVLNAHQADAKAVFVALLAKPVVNLTQIVALEKYVLIIIVLNLLLMIAEMVFAVVMKTAEFVKLIVDANLASAARHTVERILIHMAA